MGMGVRRALPPFLFMVAVVVIKSFFWAKGYEVKVFAIVLFFCICVFLTFIMI